MAPDKKPRCFIAMAFDYEDTDAIYDKAIEPVLKRNDVIPEIISRREDTRDINYQIIEQLNGADFCIVDLTYARPSVYFEAGYAERQVGVIYTVRSDHLKKDQPEDRRVHFDLQMKPIIKWKNPEDATFPQRLERRLRNTVLKDWRRRQKQEKKEQKERQEFNSLSVHDRLQQIRSTCIKALRKHGFTEWELYSFGFLGGWNKLDDKNPAHFYGRDVLFITKHKIKKKGLVVSIIATDSLTLKKLKDEIGRWFIGPHPPHLEKEYFPHTHISKLENLEEHHFIISLKKTPSFRIMSAMPSLSQQREQRRYFISRRYERGSFGKLDINLRREIFFYFISNVDRMTQFKKELQESLNYISMN